MFFPVVFINIFFVVVALSFVGAAIFMVGVAPTTPLCKAMHVVMVCLPSRLGPAWCMTVVPILLVLDLTLCKAL